MTPATSLPEQLVAGSFTQPMTGSVGPLSISDWLIFVLLLSRSTIVVCLPGQGSEESGNGHCLKWPLRSKPSDRSSEKFPAGAKLSEPVQSIHNIFFQHSKQIICFFYGVYVLGRTVLVLISRELPAGKHTYRWNAAAMSSGVYFYRLQAETYSETKKLVLLK